MLLFLCYGNKTHALLLLKKKVCSSLYVRKLLFNTGADLSQFPVYIEYDRDENVYFQKLTKDFGFISLITLLKFTDVSLRKTTSSEDNIHMLVDSLLTHLLCVDSAGKTNSIYFYG